MSICFNIVVGSLLKVGKKNVHLEICLCLLDRMQIFAVGLDRTVFWSLLPLHSQVRESVINRFLIAKHHFILSDLVNEEEIPSLG